MKRIILSVLAIMLTVGVVSGTAYALFSDTVQVNGMILSTGNADLQISTVGRDTDLQDSATFNILNEKMYPGFTKESPDFWLRNSSQSQIDLRVTGQLISATEDPTGSWNALKDVVKVRFTKTSTGGSIEHTLAEWNAMPRTFDWILSPVGDSDTYRVRVTMDSGATNDAAMKMLKDIRFDFVGTQIVY